MVIKRKRWLIYMAIIALQIMTVLYWGIQKENYNIDELYSKESACRFANTTVYGQYIYNDPEFEFNKWVSNSVYKRRLIVTEDDTIFKLPLIEIVKKMIKGRNYNGFLNMSESLFGYDFISSRPALAINILFFIIGEMFFILLLKRMDVSEECTIMAMTMFGFSVLMVSITNYVRFYSIAVMLAMMIFNLAYTSLKEERLLIVFVAEIGALLLAYLSLKDTELTLPYFGALSLFCLIALFIRKQWKKVILFLSFFVIGGIYISLTTDFVTTLINPGSSSQIEVYRGIAEKIHSISLGEIWSNVVSIIGLIFSHYFATLALAMAMLISIAICLMIKDGGQTSDRNNTKSASLEIDFSSAILFAVWSVFFVVAQTLGYGVGLCFLALVILLAYQVFKKLDIRLDIRRVLTGDESGFVCILAATAVLYTLFVAMGGMNIWRYCFPVIIIAPIILWYVADKAINTYIRTDIRKNLYVILTIFTIANAVIPFLARNIENIYEDDKELKDILNNYSNMQVVMISKDLKDGAGTIDDHEVYDCVWQMSDEASIYCVDYDSYHYEEVDYPDDFILWSNINKDLAWIIEELEQNGFEIDKLGVNHVSQVYHCKR